MDITLIFISKFIISILFVLILSLLVEYSSPRISGLIAGLPTSTALILFFYGLELGPKFASESSIYNLVGMISIHIFIYFYFITSNKNSKLNIFFSSLVAILSYVLTVLLLKNLNFSPLLSFIIPLISIFFFTYLFKNINNSKIKNKIKLTPKILLVRAILASFSILIVTMLAHFLNPNLAGLLSAFPTTIFPLLLIVHNTYGKEHVHTIIKHIPQGQISVVIYVIGIFFLYPLIGIYLGTLISYLLVCLFLYLFFKIKRRKN